MIFKDILQNIVESTEGGLSATLMGYDGIEIADFDSGKRDINIQTVAVEFCSILKKSNEMVQQMSLETLRDIVIVNSAGHLLLHPIQSEYFVALLMNPEGNVGKARYLINKHHQNLIEQL